jgi:hypothetical protein
MMSTGDAESSVRRFRARVPVTMMDCGWLSASAPAEVAFCWAWARGAMAAIRLKTRRARAELARVCLKLIVSFC